MTVIVTVGGPEDIDAAVDVYVRGGSARRGEPASPARIEQVRATIKSDDTWFFVAKEQDIAIGMAVAMPSREDFGAGVLLPGVCYLDLIFVVPERWGESVGSLLLDTIVSDARLRGFARITLLTHDDNDRAQTLYRSRGFERTGWSRLSSDPRNGMVSEWAYAL